MGRDDTSTVTTAPSAPAGLWFRRATGLDVRRALAGSGLAVIVSTVLFALSMWIGFPGIERDPPDTFGLWLTVLALWALATTVGPVLLAWLAGIPLDRCSRGVGERRAALLFGLLGGLVGAAAGGVVWSASHSVAAAVVFFAPIWFVSGFVGRLGLPAIMRRRWLFFVVVGNAGLMGVAALVLLVVSSVNLIGD